MSAEQPDDGAVVFLDVDGVLNHSALYAALAPRRGQTEPGDWLDEVCIARLNRLCAETGARLVISSSWRTYHADGAAWVDGWLRGKGLTAEVIGSTPDLTRAAGGDIVVGAPRWTEIRAWLDAHPEVTRWVVLDDCDMPAPPERFVRTDIACGLTDADVARAVAALGNTPGTLP